jgi:hypothetical protein
MRNSRNATLVGFACGLIFLVAAYSGIREFISKQAKKTAGFEQKALAISVGDHSTLVLAKMFPYQPTTNNMDLLIGSPEVMVFRLQGLMWIYYLGEDQKVVRIISKKT